MSRGFAIKPVSRNPGTKDEVYMISWEYGDKTMLSVSPT